MGRSQLTRRAMLVAGAAATSASATSASAALPRGFLWGAATAGHQVEGNNLNSDIWLLEHLPHSPFAEKSGDACDHYHRYASDIRLLAGLGLNAFRFSIEWSRVEPEPGEFSNAELEHYRRVAATCRDNGVTPLVTFNHFTVPRWVAARGGFEVPETVDLFVRFCERAVGAVGAYAGLASIFNEPNIGRALKYIVPPNVSAMFPMLMKDAAKAVGSERFSTIQFADQAAALPNMITAYEKAYPVVKGGPGDFPVGVSLLLTDEQAVGADSVRDSVRADLYGAWLAAARRTGDFVGVQTYGRNRWDNKGRMDPPAGARMTQMGEEFYPEALERTIRLAHAATGKPIYVTENGVATAEDAHRSEYIRRALAGLGRCLTDGIPIRGYIHWSLLDNYEWVAGYAPKFGLIAVDRKTQVRTVKPSARYLSSIAKSGRLPTR